MSVLIVVVSGVRGLYQATVVSLIVPVASFL